MFSENGLKAAYSNYGQDFESVKDFKKQVNSKLGDHVFAFTDRQKNGPWLFLKCPPPPLPKFKFEYGPEYEKKDKKKRKRSEKKTTQRTKRRKMDSDESD